ncbi:flagellar biosynthesis protein FlgB [Pandoraea thiooxydans]|uniref:Flagellar basal body rod protein FlgB n=1 Tax=Pandoraea thiooxydans TaxID=445709 RepID=A0A0G3EUK4_9BURK|nr:flagellar basal body rod protein FlgB [Pandoraea thiooxydans]AKJ69709.1 flagellar basal-body rod protein FlgB [Pandoraea thiooxydans]APR97445.1 flagellar biosynthesis protein FlgB [Pandoraea thiooxydans]
MVDKLDAALRFNQDALDLRAYRQEVLSSNIANADTPGYKARDFAFGSALAQAVERGAQSAQAAPAQPGGPVLLRTSARQFAGQAMPSTNAGAPAGVDLAYRVPYQPSVDGNTVDLDNERVRFADNVVHYETGLTVISNQIKQMLAAIQQ